MVMRIFEIRRIFQTRRILDIWRVPGLLLCALALASAQEDPLKPRELTYVALLGDAEIGRETVSFSRKDWRTKGRFDVLGTRKGDYEGAMTLTDSGFVYDLSLTDKGPPRVLKGVFSKGKFTASVPGTEKSKSVDIEGDVTPLPYDDLIWSCFIGIGRFLADHEARGALGAGLTVPLVVGSAAVTFNVEHVESEAVTQQVGGRSVALRVSRLRFPGELDFIVVTTPEGLPLRIDIPAQKIVVRAEGYETVEGKEKKPTSIVDAGPWREKLSKPDQAMTVEKKVMIPMRDGVRLAADVYRPAGEGRFPAILSRTPYDRRSQGALEGSYYAKRGYVYIAQDVRGRFDSEGHWFPFINETIDGSDTIDWVAAQSWCDGQVGMIGASYVGLVQWLAAKSGNPHLKCIVPQVSPPDPQENFPYEGGAFLMGAAWWARVLESMKNGTDWRAGLDWAKAFKTTPLKDLDEAMALKEPSFLDTWLQHPPHDRAFWSHASYQHLFSKIDLPAFHVSGWYDGDMPGALMNFAGMQAEAPSERARKSQYLVMGPWTHFFNSARRIGEVDFGDEAVVDLDSRILRFFDHYLKGIDTGIDAEPPVLTFTMGSNRWHGAASWPLPGTQFTRLHLSNAGDATKRDGDGRLGLAPPSGGKASTSYRYDPDDLPELDVDFTDISGAEATADRNKDPDRTDALDFTSPPLAAPCEVVGPIEVVLYVETDAADTDFLASVYRVTAKGESFAVRAGLQRLRYAKNPREDNPVPPGTITKVTIDCWATGLRLEKGDRIRVGVSSWGWPAYDRQLNTLERSYEATRAVVATNVVHHTKEHPSHLLLPVVPREDAPGLRFEEK